MESNKAEQQAGDRTDTTPVVAEGSSTTPVDAKLKSQDGKTASGKQKCKKSNGKINKKITKKAGKSKDKSKKEDSSSEESDSSSSDSETEEDTEATTSSDSSSESSDSDSETDKRKKRRKAKDKKAKLKLKEKKKAKLRRKVKEVSSDSESDSLSESAEESDSDSEDEDSDQDKKMQQLLYMQQLQNLQQLNLQNTIPADQQLNLRRSNSRGLGNLGLNGLDLLGGKSRDAGRRQNSRTTKQLKSLGKRKKGKKSSHKKSSSLEYKRVDQIWDSTIHNYKLQDTAEEQEDDYEDCLFLVRRRFDWEGKYTKTVVDIKSKLIKEALNEVMDGVKGTSFVEEKPSVDPNLLFLYLEDILKFKKDLKKKLNGGEKMKKKLRKRNELKLKHLKLLTKYLDKDYADVKKTLYPMLKSGLITFDLLWALYKPNTIAFTTTYGTHDEPRAFKIDYAEKEFSFMKGESYSIEGKYLEYDGKVWGMGSMESEVASFKGARKITSLNCYPLQYHHNEEKLRKDLIERGKKFVALQGVHYRSHQGLAYYKKKRQVIKVNINGRVMVDPAIHRRMLPNYAVSTVKPKDADEIEDSECEDDSESGCGCESSDNDGDEEMEEKTKLKIILDDKKKPHLVRVPVDEEGQEIQTEKLDVIATDKDEDTKDKTDADVDEKKVLPTFTDDEYLIASPVVLGFAFAEKLWLEFTVSGIKDIVWNEGAYDSLVLENNAKEIIKALVESHKYHPAESIDDVIQGKGKGLVAVLHGPPGTGKTLTAEGISELLKCPLYMVSAGELGTDPRGLEAELQKILDIAHAWGAVLLLDEADVFLEKRTIQDIHRNALVSIFLRLLEYFQGILFLTTNRVETFDDAFQSRIHIALRYGELSLKAKKAVFKMFIERVRLLENIDTMPFTEEDFLSLAKHNLNGRQIKNTVRTAQALAVNKKEPLGMEHIRRVLDVQLAFDRDLKGGTGYMDAMRAYN